MSQHAYEECFEKCKHYIKVSKSKTQSRIQYYIVQIICGAYLSQMIIILAVLSGWVDKDAFTTV